MTVGTIATGMRRSSAYAGLTQTASKSIVERIATEAAAQSSGINLHQRFVVVTGTARLEGSRDLLTVIHPRKVPRQPKWPGGPSDGGRWR